MCRRSFKNTISRLSWALLCAPIAVQTRLTIYWYVRKIAGPGLMAVYNVVNGVLYCGIAGAMISVAARTAEAPGGGAPSRFHQPKMPHMMVPIALIST